MLRGEISEQERGAGTRRATVLALLFVFGLTVLRLLTVWLSPLELDAEEAQYWTWSRDLAFGYFSKPPLIAWAISAATAWCGDGEGCIRTPPALLHVLAAVFVFLAARRLFDARVAAWSAAAYASLPGVALSASVMTTDAPLLACWAAALWCYVRFVERPGLATAWPLGLALGLGLLSKYAMGYFLLSVVLHLVVAPAARRAAWSQAGLLALALALAILAPNLAWNVTHGFATFGHTAANIGWSGSLLHPDRLAAFAASQFAVFGPLPLAVLLWRLWRLARGEAAGPAERLLLAFTLPVLLLLLTQSLLSRAHANWAATAYVAAAILVPAWLLGRGRGAWLKAAVGLDLALGLLLQVAAVTAASRWLPGQRDPLDRVRGWEQVATASAAALATRPGARLLLDDRQVAALMLYYGRGRLDRLTVWDSDGRPSNQFEATRGFRSAGDGPVLLLARYRERPDIVGRFASVEPVRPLSQPLGQGGRTVYLTWLAGYRGKP
ncbi:MAG: glycosyltransferase family 39 protein [Alphaproteobacteria bacterium]|nr:glycosyltransferase family 39 protein [Alphaproteobacteria bacterium]